MKRFLISILTGIIVGCLLVWGADQLIGKHYLSRIKWSNAVVYIFFFAGFIWALWLNLWNKCLNRFIWQRKKPEAQAAQNTNVATSLPAQHQQQATQSTEQNTQQPAQTSAQPAQSATQTATNGILYRPAKIVRPMAMSVQNNAVMSVNAPDSSNGVTPTSTAGAPATGAPIRPAAQKEHDIAILSDIDPDLDMMAFKHVALEGKVLDLVYSSDDVAVLCKLFSDEHTWTVKTDQSIEECSWTNEQGDVLFPCKDLLAQTAILEKMETEAEIIPTVVLMRGQINDYDNVQQYLLQNNIYLVQYESNGAPGVKTLHELLKEKFVLFTEDEEEPTEEEEQNEPEENNETGEDTEESNTEEEISDSENTKETGDEEEIFDSENAEEEDSTEENIPSTNPEG